MTKVYGNDADVRLKDESGSQTGVSSNRLQTEAFQPDLFTVFNQMLQELKKTNVYLAKITDIHVESSDIE
jgi:hypothetical protein